MAGAVVIVVGVELRAGDVISVPGGRGVIHRIPIDRRRTYTAYWYRQGPNSDAEPNGEVTFQPTEEVEVHRRYPE